MTSIEIIVDAAAVEEVLGILEAATSPESLGEWLGSDVSNFLQQRAVARFASEGDDASGKWAPLSDATVAIREALGYGGSSPINVRTGELMDFITSAHGDVGDSLAGVQLSFPGGNAGDSQTKFNAAQSGNKKSGAPARPVVAIGEEDLTEIMILLTEHIVGALGGDLFA